MQILWGILLIIVGAFLLISASMKSEFIIYRLLVNRSKILWGDKVHRFHQVAGVLVIVFGVIVAAGMFN